MYRSIALIYHEYPGTVTVFEHAQLNANMGNNEGLPRLVSYTFYVWHMFIEYIRKVIYLLTPCHCWQTLAPKCLFS